jgi:GDP-4-dehydro-6-deoxy-D-mannose reductase
LRDDAPEHLFRTNVEGTIALLEAVADADVAVERIVLGSSGAVYGETAAAQLPLREGLPCVPADLYSVSKLAAEQAARVVARVRGLSVSFARIFNVVGAGQDERHVVGRFASQLAAIAAGRRAPRVEIGDVTPTRDFIDVRDVAIALGMLADRAEPDAVYNVASGHETSIGEVLEHLVAISQLAGRIELVRSYARPADLPRYVGDAARLTELGFAPRHSLPESLAAVYDYYVRVVAASG